MADPLPRGRLRLLGAPGSNLEMGPISNAEEGGKHIFWDLGPLNGVGHWSAPLNPPLHLALTNPLY